MTRMKSVLASTTALAAASPVAGEQIMSPAWDMLAAIEVEEIVSDTYYEVRKVFPAEMKDGIATFDITGFAVPMNTDGSDVTDLYLVSDMGFCPFCGDPDHGSALQVTLATPIPSFEDGTRLSLRGSLQAITDSETWQTAIMKNATVLDG